MVSYKGLTLTQKWDFKDRMNRLNNRRRYAERMMKECINNDEVWRVWFEKYGAVLTEKQELENKMFLQVIENITNHETNIL